MNFRCPGTGSEERKVSLPCFSFGGPLALHPLRSPRFPLCAQRNRLGRPQLSTPRNVVLQCSAGGAGPNEGVLSSESNDLANMVQEEEEELEQMVFLSDPATGREVQCGVDQIVEHEGAEYYLFYPRHDPVFFAEVNDDEQLVAVEDGPDVRAMIPVATAVLAEDHIELRDTAFVLTVDEDLALGQIKEDEDDDDADDGQLDEEEEDDEDEGNVEVISEFHHEGRHILIAKPTEPTLLVAEKKGDDFRVIVGAELDSISGALENVISH